MKYNGHKNCAYTEFSKKLRKNMTKEERKLWYDFLKRLPVTVNRQKVFGQYIVDFYCAKYNVIIEIDGGQHFDEKFLIKDSFFNDIGIKVLRYSNMDIRNNFEGVCSDILLNLKGLEPPSSVSVETASPKDERGKP